MRLWTGLRQKGQSRFLGESEVTEVVPIRITTIPIGIWINGTRLSGLDCERLARADGFPTWWLMANWFDTVHGMPFGGVLVRWL